MAVNPNVKAYRAAVDVFNKGNGDLSGFSDLLADEVVHYTPAPEIPVIMGKQAWIQGATLAVQSGGWVHQELLADSGADDFTTAIIRNTHRNRYESSVGVARWREGKMAEIWSVGHQATPKETGGE